MDYQIYPDAGRGREVLIARNRRDTIKTVSVLGAIVLAATAGGIWAGLKTVDVVKQRVAAKQVIIDREKTEDMEATQRLLDEVRGTKDEVDVRTYSEDKGYELK